VGSGWVPSRPFRQPALVERINQVTLFEFVQKTSLAFNHIRPRHIGIGQSCSQPSAQPRGIAFLAIISFPARCTSSRSLDSAHILFCHHQHRQPLQLTAAAATATATAAHIVQAVSSFAQAAQL
jgi:hypothetical protein